MATRIPTLDELGFGSVDLGAVTEPTTGSAPYPAVAPPPPMEEEEEEEEESNELEGLIKLDPAVAGYRDYIVLCGECARFSEPSMCSLINGAVSKDGSCPHGVEKEAEDEGMVEEMVESLGSGNDSQPNGNSRTEPAGGSGEPVEED